MMAVESSLRDRVIMDFPPAEQHAIFDCDSFDIRVFKITDIPVFSFESRTELIDMPDWNAMFIALKQFFEQCTGSCFMLLNFRSVKKLSLEQTAYAAKELIDNANHIEEKLLGTVVCVGEKRGLIMEAFKKLYRPRKPLLWCEDNAEAVTFINNNVPGAAR